MLLHGVNAVWKRAPYVAPSTAAGFTAKDADFLATEGFNSVRLGVLFAGVMPRRGVVDQGYLRATARVVKLLTDRHIWVLLDFHQDLYSERFRGEGFPAWAVDDDGLPQPVNAGFPGNYFLPATSRAFDNFYANVNGLADLYAKAWQAVAATFAQTPYVLGYDLMNEPWPGTSFASCANPAGCPAFDAQLLQPVYDKAIAAIRKADSKRIVWLEPHVLFNDGAQTTLGTVKPFTDPQLGLSWHQYCTTAGLTHSSGGKAGPDCGPQGELVFRNAAAYVKQHGFGQLLTEFGASDDLGDVTRITDAADAHLVGWEYWHYKEWSDPTTESADSGGQGLFTKDTDLRTLKQAKANILIRPYARAVAGIPTSMSFTHGVFSLTYTAKPSTGLTEVFVPARHFPRGYRVRVSGGTVVSKAGAPLLLIKAPREGSVRVSVVAR
ncbi:MAG: endoglycoceramidase [Frankiales bacterium]|nr:endoglycoceramidase [Frankiales bacterium]